MKERALTDKILSCSFTVHSELGPGLLESAYQKCLAIELAESGLSFKMEQQLDLTYKDTIIKNVYRLDFIVENKIILELKSIEAIAPIHKAQLITYLKLSNTPVGLLLNFNTTSLKNGIHRLYNPNLTDI